MPSSFKGCQIHVIIEKDDQVIFAGAIGEGRNWTKLECAFIVQAMAGVMDGSTDELIVNMGIARLVGVSKRVGAAAAETGLSRRTFTKLISQDVKYRKKRELKKDEGGKA